VVVEGTCAAGGALGAVCRLGCTEGFEASGMVDGLCQLSEVGTVAGYSGQAIACTPEEGTDHRMSAAYCRTAASEAVLDCCELSNEEAGTLGSTCSVEAPVTQCVVGCAEIWYARAPVRFLWLEPANVTACVTRACLAGNPS
jgi:hypothetical protein